MEKRGVDLIVLAGFILKVPDSLVNKYEKKIILIGSKKLFTFDEGLKKTIEWYKKEKNLFKNL